MNPNSMTSRILVLCAVLILLVSAGSGVTLAQQAVDIEGEPELEIYTPDNTFSPGQETSLELQIDNNGEFSDDLETNRDSVTTARNVIVDAEPEDSAPFTITTGKQAIGSITEERPATPSLALEIPDDAEPGTYEIEVEIEYTYTEEIDVGNFNSSRYDDRDDRTRTVDREIEIEIDDNARFRVTDVDSTLRVGEEGDITGTITNVGGEDATSAEVQFPTESSNIEPLETSVAVGDLSAGESASFRIPIDVGSEAEAVPKRFELPVSFRDENGIRQTDDDPEFLADIAPERDEFTIEAVNRSVTGGETQVMAFTITNNRDETVTAVEPKLFTDSPFSSDNDEAFVESLDPGESATVSFDLSADEGVTPKTYPVTVDIRYDDGDGDSQISESYRVAVDVLEPEDDGGVPLWILVGGAVVTGGIGLAVRGFGGNAANLLRDRVASVKPAAGLSAGPLRHNRSTASESDESAETSGHSKNQWPTPEATDRTDRTER